MKISIVWDDCPPEVDNKGIIAVFSSRTLANEFIREAKRNNEYRWQYLTIKDETIRSTRLGLSTALANRI